MRMAMPMPMPDLKETPELKFKLEPGHNGTYECRVSSSVGTSTCTFNVSGESAGKEKKKKKKVSQPDGDSCSASQIITGAFF